MAELSWTRVHTVRRTRLANSSVRTAWCQAASRAWQAASTSAGSSVTYTPRVVCSSSNAKRGIEPLRTLSTYRRNDAFAGVTFGMNAIVIAGAGATVRVGDTIEAVLRF